jgi:hydrogenase nickel incorporation protein HypA/HybF
MHELSLMADLMRKLDTISRAQHPAQIVDVTIKFGALAHVSAQHLREHFVQTCRATP